MGVFDSIGPVQNLFENPSGPRLIEGQPPLSGTLADRGSTTTRPWVGYGTSTGRKQADEWVNNRPPVDGQLRVHCPSSDSARSGQNESVGGLFSG